MNILVLILSGLVFGSFVNALVWRLHEQEGLRKKKSKLTQIRHRELSILRGRSMCSRCHHQLATKDLVPVFSWLWLRGKCRYCHQKIDDTPLAELITAGLFVFSYVFWPHNLQGVGLFQYILWLIFLVGFVALSIYDLRWRLLPDKIIYPLVALALIEAIALSIFSSSFHHIIGSFEGLLALGGLFYLLFQLSGGRWIGGGDVKLGALIGLIVAGPVLSILVLFLASFSGCLYAIPLMIERKFDRNSHISFGPFLILGAIIAYLFGASIIDWYRQLLL